MAAAILLIVSAAAASGSAEAILSASSNAPVTGQQISFDISSSMQGLEASITTTGLTYDSNTGLGGPTHVVVVPGIRSVYTYTVIAKPGETVSVILSDVVEADESGTEYEGRRAVWMATASAPPPTATITTIPDFEGEVMLGIPISTADRHYTVGALHEYLSVPEGASITVLDADGAAADGNTLISTGQTVEIRDGSGALIASATVIVAGDVLGTGRLTIAQLTRMSRACSGEEPLSGAYLAAGDFNSNGHIDIADMVREAKLLTQG